MQIKTENSVEAASAILRTLRHAVPVLLSLLIALLAAAPVLADETDEAITDTETVSAEPTEDLRDDYTAVAAQLEAVARAKWSAKGILPFLAVVLLAFLGLSLAVRPMRRRRVHSARAYRPMRDRTLNDTAFQGRAHSTL